MKKLMRKFGYFNLLIILVVSLFFIGFPLGFADGESWLTDWNYRKSHVINYASGVGTNYQTRIVVDFSSGSDSGDTVYIDGKCKTDFGDIRFTDNDGNTELDYWMEDKTDSDNAIFWVEVADDLSSVNVVIYVYYGNNAVSTTSDVKTTFLLGDEFVSWDSDIWGEKPAWATIVSSTVEIVATNADHFLYSIATFNRDVAFGIKSKQNFVGGVGIAKTAECGFKDKYSWNDKVLKYEYLITVFGLVIRASGSADQKALTDIDQVANTYFRHEITWETGEAKYYIDSILEATINALVPNANLEVGLRAYDNEGNEVKNTVDWVYVRKYVDPEPVHGDWGNEESDIVDCFITFYLSSGGSFEVNSTVKTNGTITEYTNMTILVLKGIVKNASYIWLNFSWIEGNSTINNYNYTVLSNNTIWCYFNLFSADGIHEDYFALGFVISGCAILFFVIVIKDKKDKEK